MKSFILLLLMLLAAFPGYTEQYRFSSRSLQSVMAEGRESTVLEGDVIVQSDKKKIMADRVEIQGKDFQFFICEGNVVVEDLEQDFTLSSDIFHYDNENRIIRINGPSVMEDRENEMIIKCGFLENREDEDLIIMQVGVRILKEDLACRSEFAVYFRDRNILELTGLPVVYRKDDVFRASKITVNLDNDEISMEGVVKGSLLSRDEEEDSTPQAQEDNETGPSAEDSSEGMPEDMPEERPGEDNRPMETPR
ncbi:MAG: hypothetical protein PQJ50_14180 [Spirochaetales bacterium]|nr:hypothetical protein [Spirochaetales bacterium]